MKNILSNCLQATTLSLGLLITSPVLAQQLPPAPVLNGVLHPRDDKFFVEGREKLETEIQNLSLERSLADTLLKIRTEKIERQEKPLPDNQPQTLPLNKD
ncbi:hypothetical protein [Nostoc sp. FACHB-110]|uniref:hypothetical protein n=1 Tax=Nostoc sp. FACHB-110 TaxID=2692834 RepID=UPI0016846939|nr:hypothetical protein [Nostoc sp. FACHB-110]MBD2438460.1 hypothetical protein [Nostoc sp. FACHB-110]